MTFVKDILSLAPEGSNEYAYAARFVATIIPPKPYWYFPCMIAAGVVAAINLLSTIVCFVVMWRRSRAGTGVGLWFFKTCYGHSSGIPYIMPNALTMFLFWNLVFMLLMQPYIWLNYYAYYAPSLQITSRMYFWYGFTFIWDAIGMWTSAFGTLYATLLPRLFTISTSNGFSAQSFLLHPVTLNSLCFLPPIGLAITQIITSAFSAIAWSNLVHTQFSLIDLLGTLAKEWTESGGTGVHPDDRARAEEMGALFIVQKDKSLIAFQRNAWTCGLWYLLCLVLFTPTAIWLLSVIREAVSKRTRRPAHKLPMRHPLASHPSTAENIERGTLGEDESRARDPSLFVRSAGAEAGGRGDRGTWAPDSRRGNFPQHDETLRLLQRAYFTASLQFGATFAGLAYAAGIWIWAAADARRMITNRVLHALAILGSVWVWIIVGCFVNGLILIRTRRPDDSSGSGGNVMQLSVVKSPQTSAFSSTNPRSDVDRKPVRIRTHTTTHVFIENMNGEPIEHRDSDEPIPGSACCFIGTEEKALANVEEEQEAWHGQ